jgi:hypothetical protein
MPNTAKGKSIHKMRTNKPNKTNTIDAPAPKIELSNCYLPLIFLSVRHTHGGTGASSTHSPRFRNRASTRYCIS